MTSLFKKHFPDVNFRFVFINNNTIASLFKYSYKDVISILLCSNIAYCFQCPDCTLRYIGSTGRNLKIRISELKGVSSRTGLPISNPSFSKIREHTNRYKHTIREQDFSIMYKATLSSDRYIAESLTFMKEKPYINGTEVATKLLVFS